MKLHEYIKHLQDFVKENPSAADHTVVTSIDEGNGYNEIYPHTPGIGYFSEDGEFLYKEELSEWYDEGDEWPKVNAVCVN